MSLPIKNIIQGLLEDSGDWRFYLLKNWEKIIGNLHAHVRLERIDKTTLILGVYQSSWMQELFLLSRILITTINQKLSHPYVTHLRFVTVAPLPVRLIKRQKQVIYKPGRTVLTKQEEKALACIADIELQKALRGFLARCTQELI